MAQTAQHADAAFPQGTAVVIGGTGGFGEAICHTLARQGSDVTFTYRSSAAQAQTLAAQLQELGVRSHAVQLDVSNIETLEPFFNSVAKVAGDIHTLIHAYGPMISLKYLSATAFSEMRDVILGETLPFFGLVKAALPHLRRAKGSLVAVHSVGLLKWPLKDGLSVVPKAGIAALIQGIAREEGRNGVRANAVAPGVIDAGMFHKLQRQGDIDERYVKATRQMVPLERLGEAQDVAEVAVFLASPRAKYVTGQTIAVDGGFST